MILASETPLTGIDLAKKAIAPLHKLSEWKCDCSTTNKTPILVTKSQVQVGINTFLDNTERSPIAVYEESNGDTLPHVPTVLTGCCNEWAAFKNNTWNVAGLSSRTKMQLSLDGGPSFARQSIRRGTVSLKEYERYCNSNSDGDVSPLYIFDPDILISKFRDGSLVSSEYSTPTCFKNDMMHCLTGTRFRPLPPAWLLVGTTRSGTPIHDHPYTIAWNALLSGTKLWCCLPPNVDEELLLLNLDENGCIPDDEPFDLSAMEWFLQTNLDKSPMEAKIIVQQPGEVVYLPKGWYHVVLNVKTSIAISVSLTLRRDLIDIFPYLIEEDYEFAQFWLSELENSKKKETKEKEEKNVSDEDMKIIREIISRSSSTTVSGSGCQNHVEETTCENFKGN